MHTDRRLFLQSSAISAAAAALPFLGKPAFASTKLQLGSATLSIVSDGNLVLPGNFVVPADFPPEEIAIFLKQNSLPEDRYQPACNVGSGPNFMPSAGKLVESLEAAEIDPSDITDIAFTHAHPDHLWGLIDDFDEMTFPNAEYYMHGAEWDYWRASDTIEKTPESRKAFVVGAQNRMAVIEDRIKLFNYGDEVLPGVEAVNTAGHTPGHTSFALHQGSDTVMVLGDAITHPVISFQKYDWPSGGDQDHTLARESRKKLLWIPPATSRCRSCRASWYGVPILSIEIV